MIQAITGIVLAQVHLRAQAPWLATRLHRTHTQIALNIGKDLLKNEQTESKHNEKQ